MSNYDNTNKGTLFKNDKGDNPKRPDYQGKINVNGKESKIAAWIQTPKNGGEEFIAITVTEIVPQEPKEFLKSADTEEIPF
jgi:uncharacterized protein (DUF736 family)